MIPKIIHYCWFGPKEITPVGKKCIASWKKFLPDYEIKFWNEENSPINVPFVKDALDAKKYAFAADYVRIWALEKFGGIYFDTDMLLLKPLDNLLNYKAFAGYEIDGIMNSAVLGSLPNCDFIKKSLDFYNNLVFDINKINEISIPQNLTKVFNSLEEDEKPQMFDVEYFYAFPFEKSVEGETNYKKYLTKNSIAVHLWDASWLPELCEYRENNRKVMHKLYMWCCNLKNKIFKK